MIVGEIGKVYDVKLKKVRKGADDATLVKANFVRPSSRLGRLIPKTFTKQIEFWNSKMAEKLVDGDRIVILSAEEGHYVFDTDGVHKRRDYWDVKQFAYASYSKTEKEVV